MKITTSMDLGSLAEAMGSIATPRDAQLMRDALITAGHEDTENIEEPEWLSIMNQVCPPAGYIPIFNRPQDSCSGGEKEHD